MFIKSFFQFDFYYLLRPNGSFRLVSLDEFYSTLCHLDEDCFTYDHFIGRIYDTFSCYYKGNFFGVAIRKTSYDNLPF